MKSTRSIAFFGATGGCTFSALCLTLGDGSSTCYALVRNPGKLHNMLKERNIDATQYSNLIVIQGEVQDVNAISKTLAPDGVPVDMVISGVGATPQITYCPPSIKMDNAHICETAINNMLTALRRIPSGKKPTMCVISTTGVNKHCGDVPLLMQPLYHIALKVPHADKKIMEDLLASEITTTDKRAIEDYIIVRPSFLTNGGLTDMTKIRVGDDKTPAVGYTISRDDVGMFIFERVIKTNMHSGGKGRIFSITY